MTRILAVGNYTDYQYHPFTEVAECLKTMLQPPEFHLDCSDDHDLFCTDNISRYDGVLTYADYIDKAMTDAQMEGLNGFLRSGKGLVVVHSGILYTNPEFSQMVGARFVSHPPLHEFTIHITDPLHPINRGVADFTIQDELYRVEFVPDREKNVLMEAVFEGVTHPMAWVRTEGRGRIVYLAPGHTAATFQNPDFSRAVVNSIRWAVCKNS